MIDLFIFWCKGKSLEKVLTLEPNNYERYLKENSSQITEEERNQPESYAYGQVRQERKKKGGERGGRNQG